MLELAAAAGEIDLKYLDESGFCAWSKASYTYYKKGEQKRGYNKLKSEVVD